MGEEIKILKDGETQVIPKTTSKAIMNSNKESIENDINLINGSIETTASTLNTITDETGNNISQNLSELQIIKSDLKEAIIAKGVNIPYGTIFQEYAGKIGEIETGSKLENVTVTCTSSSSGFLPNNGSLIYYMTLDQDEKKISLSYFSIEKGLNISIQVLKNSQIYSQANAIFEVTGNVIKTPDSKVFAQGEGTIQVA